MKRILLGAPTNLVKDYCFDAWIENVMSFKYPAFDILLVDNTDDKGKYAKDLENRFNSRYGELKNFNVYSIYDFPKKIKPKMSSAEKISISLEAIRLHFVGNFHTYTHLLSLESDVFPPPTVIEDLLSHNKQVVGAVYHIDEGSARKPMVQKHVYLTERNITTINLKNADEPSFMDGALKEVAHVGLGCVLIRKDVLQRIPFRFDPKVDAHPDTFFAQDCFSKGIKIFCDTSIVCEHHNKNWGIKGIDYH